MYELIGLMATLANYFRIGGSMPATLISCVSRWTYWWASRQWFILIASTSLRPPRPHWRQTQKRGQV